MNWWWFDQASQLGYNSKLFFPVCANKFRAERACMHLKCIKRYVFVLGFSMSIPDYFSLFRLSCAQGFTCNWKHVWMMWDGVLTILMEFWKLGSPFLNLCFKDSHGDNMTQICIFVFKFPRYWENIFITLWRRVKELGLAKWLKRVQSKCAM